MIGTLCSFAFLHITSQQKSATPMLRMTGRDGGWESESDIRALVGKVPFDPPNPQFFGANSIAFNDSDIYAVFDRTYRPLRATIAKSQLVDLIVANGPNAVYTISKLPYTLYDDLIESLDHSLIAYETNQLTTMSVSVNMETKLTLRQSPSLSTKQDPLAPAAETTKAITDELVKNPMFKSDAHKQFVNGRELMYQYQPIVKIYGAPQQSYLEFSARQRRANALFDAWVQKETSNTDMKLYNYLERLNLWRDTGTLFRCKTMNDLASLAPETYQTLITNLLKSPNRNGYANEDDFRRELASAATTTAISFTIRVGLEDGGGLTATYP